VTSDTAPGYEVGGRRFNNNNNARLTRRRCRKTSLTHLSLDCGSNPAGCGVFALYIFYQQ